MTGFKCGVALFLASTQLPKLFGFHGAHGDFWENSGHFFKHLHETNPTSLLVGGTALTITNTETMAMGSGQTVGSLLETHEFEEKSGVTSMRITQAYESKEARDGALASGMDQGMEAGYQQLDALVAQPA